MTRVLMCRPTYFDVPFQTEENSWMDPNYPPNRRRAIQQWKELYMVYEALGIRISLLRPRRDLFDQVFTCNIAWGHGGIYMMANPSPSWRKDEVPIAAQWLVKNRMSVMYLPEYFRFEGQGDVVSIGDAGWLFCFGARNDPEVYTFLERMISLQDNKKPFIPLQIVDERFYHGDLCVRYSRSRNALLYIPEAFRPESRKIIENLPLEKMEAPKELWVQKTHDGRKNFPMNGCYVETTETFPWDDHYGEFPRSVLAWIEKGNGTVVLHNFDEFGLSGAGHRCVTLFLD